MHIRTSRPGSLAPFRFSFILFCHAWLYRTSTNDQWQSSRMPAQIQIATQAQCMTDRSPLRDVRTFRSQGRSYATRFGWKLMGAVMAWGSPANAPLILRWRGFRFGANVAQSTPRRTQNYAMS